MRATESNAMSMKEGLSVPPVPITRPGRNRRPAFLYLSIFISAVLIVGSIGCGPSSQTDGNQGQTMSGSGDLPEITDETILERLNQARVRDVPEENGSGEPISWRFFLDEPKEVAVVEKQMNGARATIVLDIKTRSSPRAREPRELAGQIRTEWELRTGWVLRRWEIVRTENISMKYKNLPKPPPENSNQPTPN